MDTISTAQKAESGFGNSANTAFYYAGSGPPTVTAADNAWHSVSAVLNNGGTSYLNADNAHISTTTPGAGGAAGGMQWGDGNNPLSAAYTTEAGWWPSAFNTTQQTNICHNAYAYWATSISC